MRRFGKRGAAWNRVRASLKRDFDKLGIRFCENCGSTFNLSFAHRKKRRFITTEDELKCVALLCQICHEFIEYSGHDRMFETITRIIENR
jgi:hypothetical protein